MLLSTAKNESIQAGRFGLIFVNKYVNIISVAGVFFDFRCSRREYVPMLKCFKEKGFSPILIEPRVGFEKECFFSVNVK